MSASVTGLARALAAAWVVIAISGCYQEPVAITTFPPTASPSAIAHPTPTGPPMTTPEPTATPERTSTPRATGTPTVTDTPEEAPTPTTVPSEIALISPAPTQIGAGSPAPGCVDGWVDPAAGSALYQEGIAILEGFTGVQGPWNVTEMRYFTGPDVPWIQPGYPVVERWYIRASLVSDPTYRGRWLIEKRTDQIEGVSAVAPFDSFGYQSPDWTGFVGEGTPRSYVGLPGLWSGIPFDFVTGAGDSGQPGLPAEVADCLQAT